MSERSDVTATAEEHGWCKQTAWPNSAEDCYTKQGERFVIKFGADDGSIVEGDYATAGTEPVTLNHDEVLNALVEP